MGRISVEELNFALKQLLNDNPNKKAFTISAAHVRGLVQLSETQLNKEKDQAEKELERLSARYRKVEADAAKAKRTRDAATSRMNDCLSELHELERTIREKKTELELMKHG